MIAAQKLSELVDIFKCCIFTWGALTTILPAFLIAGAIIAFVPSSSLIRYLGAGSKKYLSYPIAAISGAILPACSCNIVPLFTSILKRGASIGPAFTFLYAGPAINLVSIIFTFKVIGPLLGLWRLIGVLVIAIILGLIMEKIFSRPKELTVPGEQVILESERIDKWRLIILFSFLFGILMIGSSLGTLSSFDLIDKSGTYFKMSGFFVLLVLLSAFVSFKFKQAELLDWLTQTFKLIKTIVPLFIASILIIALIAKYVDIRWIHGMLSAQKDSLGNRLFFPTLGTTFFGTILGELMYFPILSEVVFVKAFLKLGMDIGPAMALLLAGPGTSLPGFILISKFVGWKKVVAYFLISVILELIFATTLAMSLGDYICACLNLK